ncbi:MAG TPA: DedA family protein [Nitrospiraceae bacterium]|nr:DedA family protein [Nitrospiraceae bacterium]
MDAGFEWITRYGYAGIFLLLMLGIVGLPVPDETLLTFVGYLAFKGNLALLPSVTAAFLGSSTGISLSYGVGRVAGSRVVTKLSPLLHLSAEHIEKGRVWFQRWGKWALIIAYFVPGVRHLVALLAGASSLPLHIFAPFAYCGALVWSATFIGIGYGLGEAWHRQSPLVHRTVFFLAVGLSLAIFIGLLIMRRQGRSNVSIE